MSHITFRRPSPDPVARIVLDMLCIGVFVLGILAVALVMGA